MTKLSERIAGIAGALSLLGLLAVALLARRTDLLALHALTPFLVLALAVAILAFVRLRLARLAADEARDRALLAGSQTHALFEETEAFSIARSREQFERFFIPAAPILLGLLELAWAWKLWRGLPWTLAQPRDHMIACAFMAGQTFFLFLLSRYQLGVSRRPEFRWLRGSGAATGLACLASLLVAVSSAAAEFAWAPADSLAAKILVGFLALLGVESLLSFTFSLYSPRRKHRFAAAYESRLSAALTDPAAWSKNISDALDYQFGFRISETGLYRSLSRAILPLIALQLILLYAFSSFVFLGPEEEGIIERLGRPLPDRWHLSSGFHLKWPWPFETVRRFPARRILQAHIGYDDEPGARRPAVVLWTIPHYRAEDNFVVPSKPRDASNETVPVSLVTMNIPIEYTITNLYDFAYRYADPEKLIRHAAYRALTREVAQLDLNQILADERADATRRLKSDLQAEVDALGLGVRIEFVALANVHPPVAVAQAFESVVGATEESEASILLARAYAGTVRPSAEAGSAKALADADAYRARRKWMAAAEAEQFQKRLGAYQQSPEVFKLRSQLDTLRAALSGARKFIVDGPGAKEVLYFNFEEQATPDLFDLGPVKSQGARK